MAGEGLVAGGTRGGTGGVVPAQLARQVGVAVEEGVTLAPDAEEPHPIPHPLPEAPPSNPRDPLETAHGPVAQLPTMPPRLVRQRQDEEGQHGAQGQEALVAAGARAPGREGGQLAVAGQARENHPR